MYEDEVKDRLAENGGNDQCLATLEGAQDGGGLRLRLAQLPAWMMGTQGSLLQSTDEGDGLHGEREMGTIC